MKAHLAGDFEAAFDLLLFQMGRSVFTHGYTPHALDIAVRETADRPTTRMNDADFDSWSPGEAMLADRSGLSLDWLEIEDDGESFAALQALPVSDKQALFAAGVARTLKPQLAFEPQARPELEATVARLDIDFAKHVRPTAAMLWSRIAKARILDIARIVFGISWASVRSKTKKAALADAMETAFAAGGTPVGLSAGMHAAALAWTPPGFAAFDTGRIGDEADDADNAATSAADTPETDTSAEPEGSAAPETPPNAESAEATAANEGNGHDIPAEAKAQAEPDDPGGEAMAVADIADGNDPLPPVPANGHDPAPDPMEIPEFLRRVH